MPADARATPVSIPEGTPGLLGALVHERIGIFFDSDRLDILVEKLMPLAEARQCRSLLDFYYMLKYEENGPQDWVQVMDALSVQETYFWREMDQIQAFINLVVPAWFNKTSAPLRVWSAASATGEEPLSILMALAEAGWGNHPVEVVASDGSPCALERARRGIYREKSFRSLPLSLKEKYFTRVPEGWKIDQDLARRITYHQANLLAGEEINLLARSQVIFCRNVFIYFSAHAIRLTLATFASRMPRGGHLFVGASESLLKLTADFELREIQGAFGYVRV